jgi:tripartite-type tricarboxylate transporter receptor subunit TctC
VPYKGGGPAIADLLGGHVNLLFGTLTSTHDLARAGRLRALASTGSARSSVAPDVPTVAESGLPGYAVEAWYGVLAPAGTPRAVVERLSGDLAKIAQVPEVREQIRAQGAEAVGGTPEEFGRYLRAEVDKWARTVRAQGLRGE